MKVILNGQASKFLIAVAGALGEAAQAGGFDWKTLVAGLVTAAVVFLVPNGPAVVEPLK